MIDFNKLTQGVDGSMLPYVEQALKVADEVVSVCAFRMTGFMDRDVMDTVRSVLALVPEVDSRPFGGYRGAERNRLAIMPPFLVDDSFDYKLTYFRVNELDEGISVDEVIAAFRGKAVMREQIGDVFFAVDGTCQGVIDKDAMDLIRGADVDVNGTPCSVDELDIAEVNFPGQREKEIKTTVASLRIDSIAGSGFGTSRTRMAEEIKVGRLKLNGKQVASPASKVCEKDVIISKGRGRLLIDEVRGETKKGRISVVLKRYSV